jgi:opacity protein-like surface antigen
MQTSLLTSCLAAPSTAAQLLSTRPRASNAVLGVVFLLSCAGFARPARAQITVSPGIGISGEGQPTAGLAVGTSIGVVRPELELAWARRGLDRRAATPSESGETLMGTGAPIYLPAAMAEVSKLMFRIAVPLRHGSRFEPFGSVGAGLARATRQPPPGESLARTDTQGGIEAGGGATIWLTSRIGLRTAGTYFKVIGPPGNFHGAPGSGFIYTNVLRDFSLTRITVAIHIPLSGSHRGRP